MKQIDNIIINQGVTDHGDVTHQINAALDATSANFATLEAANESTKNEIATLTASVAKKVDKEQGKSLVSDTEIKRLASVQNYDDTALRAAIAKKVDAVTGKGLSTNDFTNEHLDMLLTGGAKIVDLVRDVGKHDNSIAALQSEGIITLSGIVTGVTIASGSTKEKGALVYDTVANKLIWKVMYPENPLPTYFAKAELEPLAGTKPKEGVIYRCGNDTYIAGFSGLYEISKTTVSEIDDRHESVSYTNQSNGKTVYPVTRTDVITNLAGKLLEEILKTDEANINTWLGATISVTPQDGGVQVVVNRDPEKPIEFLIPIAVEGQSTAGLISGVAVQQIQTNKTDISAIKEVNQTQSEEINTLKEMHQVMSESDFERLPTKDPAKIYMVYEE